MMLISNSGVTVVSSKQADVQYPICSRFLRGIAAAVAGD